MVRDRGRRANVGHMRPVEDAVLEPQSEPEKDIRDLLDGSVEPTAEEREILKQIRRGVLELIPAEKPTSTTLYRFFDSEDRLLYVGVSLHATLRIKAHSRDKSWWGDVVKARFEHYPTYQEALDAESVAIVQEGPRYNVKGNPNPPPKPREFTTPLEYPNQRPSPTPIGPRYVKQQQEYQRKRREMGVE